jgi:hypothetical protein
MTNTFIITTVGNGQFTIKARSYRVSGDSKFIHFEEGSEIVASFPAEQVACIAKSSVMSD